MKQLPSLILGLLLAMPVFVGAQTNNPIELNQPDTGRGRPVMTALHDRASVREFDGQPIKLADLSDLLWAANGINRPGEGKRTAPSAMNAQDIDVYVFLETGVYRYDAAAHRLMPVVDGDHRGVFSKNETDPKPAMLCLLVSDISRFRAGDDTLRREWGAIDAGMAGQNILLFCASEGMLARPRVGMDKTRLKELLHLADTQLPVMNIPVSYAVR